MKVVRLWAFYTYHINPLGGNIPDTHFCWRLNQPQGHSAAGRIISNKNSWDTIGNRTHDFLACNTARPSHSFILSILSTLMLSLHLLLFSQEVSAFQIFKTEVWVHFSIFPVHASSPWFDQSNNIWWILLIMKLPIITLFQTPVNLSLSDPNILLTHPESSTPLVVRDKVPPHNR
jgi:hypothetical protein